MRPHGLENMQASAAMYLGMQLLLPGEWAPAHRHTPNAVRLIVEGEGAYTTVDGEKCPMSRGDLRWLPGPSALPRLGLAAWISQMVDAWVTVTSFRTPREPMITPARTSPERLTLPTADCNEVVSSDERPVRWVAVSSELWVARAA